MENECSAIVGYYLPLKCLSGRSAVSRGRWSKPMEMPAGQSSKGKVTVDYKESFFCTKNDWGWMSLENKIV